MTPCKDISDFYILRIHAGPPYDDIVFKSVNWKWEYGYKQKFLFVSFKTTFSVCGIISNDCTIEDKKEKKNVDK